MKYFCGNKVSGLSPVFRVSTFRGSTVLSAVTQSHRSTGCAPPWTMKMVHVNVDPYHSLPLTENLKSSSCITMDLSTCFAYLGECLFRHVHVLAHHSSQFSTRCGEVYVWKTLILHGT